MSDDGRNQFRLSYEIAPIVLNGGIAQNLPGGLISIVSLLQPQAFPSGPASSSSPPSLDGFYAHFFPMAGTTLEEVDVAKYGFANQQVAANAIIFKPLHVSLMMVGPAPAQGGYTAKLSAFTSLKQQIDQHMNLGGTFTVATPSYIFTDCLLLSIRDVSAQDTLQAQVRWQWDFEQPLISLSSAQQAQNSLTSKLSTGAQVTGDPPSSSGATTNVGHADSGVGPSLLPQSSSQQAPFVGGQGPPDFSAQGGEPPI